MRESILPPISILLSEITAVSSCCAHASTQIANSGARAAIAMATRTRRLELAKAAGEASSNPLPHGWRTGDWLPSVVTTVVLRSYADEGILPKYGWRAPDPSETEPHPRIGERVLLTQFLDRGLSLPVHPSIRDLLQFHGAQLHHIPPNGIAHLSCFISL